jgi:hypothetical protein
MRFVLITAKEDTRRPDGALWFSSNAAPFARSASGACATSDLLWMAVGSRPGLVRRAVATVPVGLREMRADGKRV